MHYASNGGRFEPRGEKLASPILRDASRLVCPGAKMVVRAGRCMIWILATAGLGDELTVVGFSVGRVGFLCGLHQRQCVT